MVLSLGSACGAKDRSSLASDTSGAEDVTGTESDVESLGTTLVGSNGQSVATASFNGGSPGSTTLMPLDSPIDESSVDAASGTSGASAASTSAIGASFLPYGCATATIDSSAMTATYVFNECTGPLGLVALDGTVNVTWTQSGGQLTVNYSSHGFKINRATINSWQATAVVTATGSERHMVWTASLSGTTGRGRAFVRTNDKTLDWTVGQPCVTVSGHSDGTILGVELQTTIVSFSRCAAECPQSGSEITVKDVASGGTLDIKYQGGAEAVLTANGQSVDIALACGG